MSQHDYDIANADGATVRADLNSLFEAIATRNSGSTAPSTTFAYQPWFDTANNLLKMRNGANNAWVTVASLSGTTWIPYRSGTALGDAAEKTVGTSVDNVIVLDGSARLPAVDGSLLTNLANTADQVARDMAASALAYVLASNDATSITGSIGSFYLSDDFETDSLATKTNATYDAAGDYYHNPGETVTPSASGEWSGATGGYTFSGDDIANTSNDSNIYWTSSFTGAAAFEFTWNDNTASVTQMGLFPAASVGSFNSTSGVGNDPCGLGSVSTWIRLDAGANDIDAFYQNTSGTVESAGITTISTGDVIKFERDASNNVKVYKNGSLVYTFVNTESAEMHFFVWSGGAGANNVDYDDVSVTEPGTPANMTLAPTAATLDTADPTDILAYIVIDPQETITAGTDIVMTMSIDGGTTDATGSWTKVGDIGSAGEELWRVEADVSGQSGSSLTYEITTANNKEIQYHDCVGLVAIY